MSSFSNAFSLVPEHIDENRIKKIGEWINDHKDELKDRNVDLLLLKHQQEVNKLQIEAEKIRDGFKDAVLEFDEIFYLRYILSFKTAKSALPKVKSCFEYRKEHQDFIKSVYSNDILKSGRIQRAMVCFSAENYLCKLDGGSCYLVRMHKVNRKKLHEISLEHIEEEMHFSHEYAYQWQDYMTRKHRILVKQTVLLDLRNVSFSDLMDNRHSGIQSKISKLSNFLYPQSLETMSMVSPPKKISIPLYMVKTFLPKSLTSKIVNLGDHEKSMEKFKAIFSIEDLPKFLGGNMPDPVNALDEN